MDKLLNRSFVSIVIVQIASLFGDAVLRFALPLYVLNVTGSAALMGAVSAAAWLPYLVLTPIGGVAADRVNKRRIMAALDTLLALTCAAFLAFDGTVDLVGLCICALIVLYAAQSVYQPTVQAAVPFVAPREGIVRATAIVSRQGSFSNSLSALSATTLQHFGSARTMRQQNKSPRPSVIWMQSPSPSRRTRMQCFDSSSLRQCSGGEKSGA